MKPLAITALALSLALGASATLRGTQLLRDPESLAIYAARAKESANAVPESRKIGRRGNKVTYYGGPVISKVEIYPIIYGSGVPFAGAPMEAFYRGVSNSAWFGVMTQQYSTPTQSIGFGAVGTSYTEPNPSSATSLKDADLQTYLINLVKAGTIKPNANTYYPIHFSSKYSIVQSSGGTSCTAGGFCAYHNTIDITSLNVGVPYLYYSVIPDTSVGACNGGCGSDPVAFNNWCNVASHELAEAVTDPAVGIGSTLAAPLAWYNATGGELTDICNGGSGKTVGCDGKTYTVAQIYSNQDGACVSSGAAGTGQCGVVPTSTTATMTPTPTACAHPVCATGAALTAGCDPCAAAVIGKDSYCGTTAWDATCVSEVGSYCKVACAATTTTAPANPCSHAVCAQGANLASSCDPCAAKIIAQDSYCGNTKWDSVCVSEVKSICGQTC